MSAISPKSPEVSISPFIWAAMAWGLAAALIAMSFHGASESGTRAVMWALGLWAISLLDLWALAQTVRGLLRLAAGSESTLVDEPTDETANQRPALSVNTAIWGLLKFGCLGLFGFVLLRGSAIPTAGLLSGLATMVVVPLAGGLWWSQRSLNHA